MNNILDEILLSENVCINFHNEYNNNKQFNLWLKNILPEIEDCKIMQQNNPWHIYNVLDHILHSVEEINKQTSDLKYNDRRLLAYTMFLHDIGKPACHLTREQNGKTIDSFFNHNEKSADIAQRVGGSFGFNNNEVDILTTLVYKHDIFMFIKDFEIPQKHIRHWRRLTPDLIKEEIQDLNSVGNGEKYFDFLIKVGFSDSRSQNPEQTKEALNLLDKCQSMFNNLKHKSNSTEK